jgi:hypothetical protein
MFGSDWQKAEATIVLAHIETTGSGRLKSRNFVADIHPPSGPVFRATIPEPRVTIDFLFPNEGQRVSVLVKGDKVKFDVDDPRLSRKARKTAEEERYLAVSTAAPATGSRPVLTDTPHMDQSDPAARLAKLEALKHQGLMTDAEYATARQRIIDSL